MKKDFFYYKKWALEHLKKQLEPEEVQKSIYASICEVGEIIEKGRAANIGEIRTWNGKKYKKISEKKWIRYYDSHSRGSQQALKNAIREIENLEDGDVQGLLQIVLKNKSRFSDDYGKPLPEVEELSRLSANKQADWSKESRALVDNIDKLLNGTKEEKQALQGKYFTIGYPTKRLQELGLNGERFTIKAGTITRKKNKNKEHNLTAQDWKDICLAINKPLIVAKSKTEDDKFRLFVNVKVHGRFVALGVDVINTRSGIVINKVSSAYGRQNNNDYTIIDYDKKMTSEQATLLTSLLDSEDSASNIKPTEADSNIAQNNSPVNKKMTYATDVCKSVEDLTNYAKENYGITIKSEDKKGDNTEKILKCFDITERFIKKVPGLEKYIKTIIYGKIDHKTMGYYSQHDRLLKVGEFGEDVTEEQVRTGYYGEMKHTVRHEMTHAIQHMIVNEFLSDKKKEQYEQAFKESFRNAYYSGKPKDMAKIANFFLHRVIGGQDFLAAAFDLFKEYKDGDYYRNIYTQFARNLVSEKIVDTALSNLGIDKKRRHFSLKTAVGKNVEALKGATKEVARISKYALSDDAECMADAIADALGSGEKAAPLSKEIMKVVEDIVGSKSIEMLKSLYAKNKTLFVVKKSFADNFMNKRSIPTMQKSIFTRGDFDAYRITDEELKEHSIFAKTEDGCEYDLQNPTENFYYTLKKNLEKSLTWSGHKLQDRTSWNGLKISIENKKGSVRRGVDKDGHQWATKMHFDYGYIRGSEGTDGDHVDCYLGDNMDAKKVYIVHQNDPVTHKYDEDKCMLGFNTLEDAKKAYLMQYDRPGFLGKIDTMDFDEFKEFILLKRNHGKKIIKSYTDFVKSVGENFDFETMRKVCII